MPLRVQQTQHSSRVRFVNRLAQDLVCDRRPSCPRLARVPSTDRLATASAFERASRCTYAAGSSFGKPFIDARNDDFMGQPARSSISARRGLPDASTSFSRRCIHELAKLRAKFACFNHEYGNEPTDQIVYPQVLRASGNAPEVAEAAAIAAWKHAAGDGLKEHAVPLDLKIGRCTSPSPIRSGKSSCTRCGARIDCFA